jgi:hypothetical protein
VGDVDDGGTGLGEDPGELDEQPVPEGAVERAERLVEHQQPRPGGDRAREGDPLRFATGQLGDATAAVTVEVHQGEDLVDTSADLLGGPTPHARPEADVVGDRAVGEQRVILEREADAHARPGAGPRGRRPPSRMEPPAGGTRPATARSSVDLPQPEGPRTTRTSPAAACRVTSSTATRSP